MEKKEEIKKKEEKKKESKGNNTEEFFKKLGFEKMGHKQFEKLIFKSMAKGLVEAIISVIDNVEIETERQRIQIRINFK